jgi:hypothetical protein
LLVVTTVPSDTKESHASQAFSCMSCSILELQFEHVYSPNASSPQQPACHSRTMSTEKHRQHQTQQKRHLAVRHVLGISIYQLEPPSQTGAPRAGLKPILYIPAVMEVVALYWSQFIPGQLIYTCRDRRTFALQLNSASRSSQASPNKTATMHARSGQLFGNASEPSAQTKHSLHSQPHLVVVPAAISQTSSQDGDAALPATQPDGDFSQVCIHCCMLLHSVCKFRVAVILYAVTYYIELCCAQVSLNSLQPILLVFYDIFSLLAWCDPQIHR